MTQLYCRSIPAAVVGSVRDLENGKPMLDIRALQWSAVRWWRKTNHFDRGSSQRVLIAGGIAEWLHNLAMFSAFEFERFDEARFWQDFQWLIEKHPGAGLEYYREEFERLARAEPQH